MIAGIGENLIGVRDYLEYSYEEDEYDDYDENDDDYEPPRRHRVPIQDR